MQYRMVTCASDAAASMAASHSRPVFTSVCAAWKGPYWGSSQSCSYTCHAIQFNTSAVSNLLHRTPPASRFWPLARLIARTCMPHLTPCAMTWENSVFRLPGGDVAGKASSVPPRSGPYAFMKATSL